MRLTTRQRRERKAARQAYCLLACIAAAFAILIMGAIAMDRAQGVTVGQSLSSAGL